MGIKPCPYPCGWDNLTKIITKTASYFAVATLDDQIPEEIRESGIELGKWALCLSRSGKNIPDGYALVPIEPTHKMHMAGESAYDDGMNEYPDPSGIYKAMIAAAQDEKE